MGLDYLKHGNLRSYIQSKSKIEESQDSMARSFDKTLQTISVPVSPHKARQSRRNIFGKDSRNPNLDITGLDSI